MMMIGPKLSQEEIAELRQTYPVQAGSLDGLTSSAQVNFKDRVRPDDAFVYAEIVGDAEFFNIKTEHPVEIQNKYDLLGYDTSVLYLSYEVKILDDARGKHKKDNVIKVCAPATHFYAMNELQKGDRLVFPSSPSSIIDGYWAFSAREIFYVTEDEYVFSNFDESDGLVTRTGRTVQSLLREFS